MRLIKYLYSVFLIFAKTFERLSNQINLKAQF